MPELPEVETITRALAPRITGRRILSAEFRCLRILRGGDPEKMSAAVAGKRFSACVAPASSSSCHFRAANI